MVLGVDFGSSVTDAVALQQGRLLAATALSRPGPASVALLDEVWDRLTKQSTGAAPDRAAAVGVTGGRARELPASHRGLSLIQVDEPEAIARGGLHLAGLPTGMVVSCGSGTAIVLGTADAGVRHVSGTPVGGGTLQALGRLLLDGRGASEVAELAETGDASAVDTTLADVLGGSLGDLPATATAVSLGRLGDGSGPLSQAPRPADLAASLCAMIAQTISLMALNAALAHGSPPLVFVGRLTRYRVIATMIAAVLRVYRYPHEAVFPEGAEKATAIGAALVAADSTHP